MFIITVVEGTDCIWDTLASEERQKVKNGLLVPATEVIRQHHAQPESARFQ
jgi:hypothetical protein